MADGPGKQPVAEVIPTGSLTLDDLLGTGGWPRGRVVEIYGQESSGKTTLALHAAAEVQARGGMAAIIDMKHKFDREYAKKLGVDVAGLLVSQPSNSEQALTVLEALVQANVANLLIIVDDWRAISHDENTSHMGLQARLMSQALRKLEAITRKTGATVIFLNQMPQKLGMFGNAEADSATNQLRFHTSIRLEPQRVGTIKTNGKSVGVRTQLKVMKNKLAPPFRQAEVDIFFDRGVCKASEVLARAEKTGILTRSESGISFEGELLGPGRESVRDLLREDAALLQRLMIAVRDLPMEFAIVGDPDILHGDAVRGEE